MTSTTMPPHLRLTLTLGKAIMHRTHMLFAISPPHLMALSYLASQFLKKAKSGKDKCVSFFWDRCSKTMQHLPSNLIYMTRETNNPFAHSAKQPLSYLQDHEQLNYKSLLWMNRLHGLHLYTTFSTSQHSPINTDIQTLLAETIMQGATCSSQTVTIHIHTHDGNGTLGFSILPRTPWTASAGD